MATYTTSRQSILAAATSDSGTTLRLEVGSAANPRGGKDRVLYASIRIAGKAFGSVDDALAQLAKTPGSTRVSLPRDGDGTLQLVIRPVLLCVDAAVLFAFHGGHGRPLGVSPKAAKSILKNAKQEMPDGWTKTRRGEKFADGTDGGEHTAAGATAENGQTAGNPS